MYKYILIILAIMLPVSLMTHPFEVPDENAHYSSLNFLYNEGRMPTAKDKDNLSVEEMETEKIFGIVEGKNKYSFHPEYRIDQVQGNIGKYEGVIQSLNTPYNRDTYSTRQAALYPPLYYMLTMPFYKLASGRDILMRLFVSRTSSLIFTTAIIIMSYYVGLDIFKKKSYAYTLAFMTLFFPMTTYVGIGVNSDNLHNLLFAVATYLAIKLLYSDWSNYLSLGIGTVIGLDLITKPQAYILIPIFALAVVIRFRFDEWKLWLKHVFLILLPILVIAGWQEIPKFIGGNPYSAQSAQYSGLTNFRMFTTGYIRTNLTEMPVWYWGVFKWFGVTLPRPLWWIGTRLIGLSFIGLAIQFFRDLKSRQFSWDSRFAIFAIGSNLIYIVALFWFDWQIYQQFGHSLGLQARYYMPLLITQMALLIMGLTNLGWNQTSKEWIRKGIIVYFLGLQLSSLYVQLTSYYDLQSIYTFIDQISQYKPFFAKESWWYLWFPLYFAGIITTTVISLKSYKQK